MFPLLFVVLLAGLSSCSNEDDPSFLGIPLLHGPTEALVKEVVEFGCEVPNPPQNESIHLVLYKVGDHDTIFGEYTYQPGEVSTIPKIIRREHEGYLECVAKPLNASSSDITATVSRPHHLKVVDPVREARISHLGPLELLEGDTLELLCQLSAGNHVSYKWLRDGGVLAQSARHHVTAEKLRIFRTTPGDSGSYMCVASNTFNNTRVFTSNSSQAEVTIRALVSDPEISFTVSKGEGDSWNYSALVTCESVRGAAPVTFSLYNRTELVANVTVQERQASFEVPLVMRQHLGWFHCQAHNGGRVAHSQWLPLQVVPVIGPVSMGYEYDIAENYAVVGLRFSCRSVAGSHPRYQWFLNNTLLPQRGSFHYVVDESPQQSVLLVSVGWSSAGSYHCQVSDSFDHTNVFSSKRRHVDEEGLNRLPSLVVAVVFGCFTLVVLLVSTCCCAGVAYRRRTYGVKSLLSLEMERRFAAYEGEMDLPAYVEDPDVVETGKQEELDQVSGAFVDTTEEDTL